MTGDQTTTINGHQQTNAGSQTTNVHNSLKFAMSSEDVTFLFKLGMRMGMNVSVNVISASIAFAKFDFAVLRMANHPLKLNTHGITFDTSLFTSATSALISFS